MFEKIVTGGFILFFLAFFELMGYLIYPYLFPTPIKHTTFEIQIGTILDDELPGVVDPGTEFKNTRQLKVLILYNTTDEDAESLSA